jgi:hypothetical protein
MKMGNTYYDLQFEKNRIKEPSVGSLLWGATKFITKATWVGSKFIVKNAPAALGMAWEIKKEISNGIVQAIQEGQKAHKENLLEQQISTLKQNNLLEHNTKQTIKHKDFL